MGEEAAREYHRSWYQRNRKRTIERASLNNWYHVQEKQLLIILYLLENPCVVCGEDDPVVLQFDHINPKTKKNYIAKMVSGAHTRVDDLFKEIKKCQILCSNCHKRRTDVQLGSYRMKFKNVFPLMRF